MAKKQMLYTQVGYNELVEELNYLKNVRREEIKADIETARSFGDLSENAEYDEARNEQAKTEARIKELEEMIAKASQELGALKTVIEPWGMYIPSADSEEQPQTQEPAGENVRLEIASSMEGKPFILEFRGDGTMLTGWTNYEQTMQEGKWSVADGALTLEMDYEYTIAENADGGLDITVNYGQMGEKTYTMTADQAKTVLG